MKKNGITEASKRHIMKLEKSDDLLKLQKKYSLVLKFQNTIHNIL